MHFAQFRFEGTAPTSDPGPSAFGKPWISQRPSPLGRGSGGQIPKSLARGREAGVSSAGLAPLSHPRRPPAAAVGLGRELRAIEPEGHGAVVDLPRQSGF